MWFTTLGVQDGLDEFPRVTFGSKESLIKQGNSEIPTFPVCSARISTRCQPMASPQTHCYRRFWLSWHKPIRSASEKNSVTLSKTLWDWCLKLNATPPRLLLTTSMLWWSWWQNWSWSISLQAEMHLVRHKEFLQEFEPQSGDIFPIPTACIHATETTLAR